MTIARLEKFDASTLTPDQAVDSQTLAAVISTCFRMARDNRYPLSVQGQLYSLGVVLRDKFKILVGEVFDKGANELHQANATMRQANSELKEALDQINRAAAAIEKLGELVSQLTDLIKIAGLVFV